MSERVYLVDTNVLSAGAPTKADSAPGLTAWMERHSAQLYLSAITVAEVEEGIAKARRSGAARKADGLADWLEAVLHLYGARILPLDAAVARVLGKLSDQARSAGHAPGLADLAIAATAARHGYTVLTRNLRHFRPLAVPSHDPFASLPAKPR
jgi:predicted nucleic acid-binding protein